MAALAPGRQRVSRTEQWARSAWQPRPTWLARALQPLSWLYALVAAGRRAWWHRLRQPTRLPVPVVVVGNLTVGGAGKTPVVMALVRVLRAAGYQPGVISRGYGRRTGRAIRSVTAGATADEVGDEPLLIHRRTGAPVTVGARRVEAAQALLWQEPSVDVIVSDDGLQHLPLAHDVAVVVLDPRGQGNGLRLPAGPLRQAVPRRAPPHWLVLGPATTPTSTPAQALLPACATLRPRIDRAVPLQAWWNGSSEGAVGLSALAGRPLVALAGIGDTAKFFATLQDAGLTFSRCAAPDHARYDTLPWPSSTTEVVTTEKDAVKLRPEAVAGVHVWVVPLDLELPQDAATMLLQRLPPPRRPS